MCYESAGGSVASPHSGRPDQIQRNCNVRSGVGTLPTLTECPLYPSKRTKRRHVGCPLRATTGLMQCSTHQVGPFPRSVSCTCLSSALLTNSTESIAAPSWVRNCSIASFIGGGRSPHQLIA